MGPGKLGEAVGFVPIVTRLLASQPFWFFPAIGDEGLAIDVSISVFFAEKEGALDVEIFSPG